MLISCCEQFINYLTLRPENLTILGNMILRLCKRSSWLSLILIDFLARICRSLDSSDPDAWPIPPDPGDPVFIAHDDPLGRSHDSHVTFNKNFWEGEGHVLANGAMHRIIGGREERPHSYPWAIALVVQGRVYCGATLIRPDVAITAGHCLELGIHVLTAYVGAHNLRRRNDYNETLHISNAIRHERYNDETLENDIALIKFARPLRLGNWIRTIALPRPYKELPVGTMCIIVGWGVTRPGTQLNSDYLLVAKVPIMAHAVCNDQHHYNGEVFSNMMCAGWAHGGIDACQGDSGGPLVCAGEDRRPTLYGVTSWGIDCGKPGKVGVYTKIANYMDWIARHINSL